MAERVTFTSVYSATKNAAKLSRKSPEIDAKAFMCYVIIGLRLTDVLTHPLLNAAYFQYILYRFSR